MTHKILLFVIVLFSTNCFAQTAPTIKRHEIIIGYGLYNIQRAFAWKNETYKGYGTFHLKYDYFLSENISIGGTVNYAGITATVQPTSFSFSSYSNYQAPAYEIKYRSLSTNCRINFHGYNKDGLDVYCGIGAGFNFMRTIENDVTTKQTLPGFEFSLGLKCLWSDNSGFFTEIGLTKSIIQVGTFYKF